MALLTGVVARGFRLPELATTVLSNIWTIWAVSLVSAKSWKKASKTPRRLSRQKRFQTLFQLPNSNGRARQVILCKVK